MSLMKDQLEGGDTAKRRVLEEKAMEQYVRQKEQQDQLAEERKKKKLKDAELEAKRILDFQIAEQNSRKMVQKFEANTDAKFMFQDLNDFTVAEQRKKEQVDLKQRSHGSQILKQIDEKKAPIKPDFKTEQINKILLSQIGQSSSLVTSPNQA